MKEEKETQPTQWWQQDLDNRYGGQQHYYSQDAPSLTLDGHQIQQVSSYKYLGIQINNQLRWNTQVQKATAKGLKWVLQLNRLAKQAVGIPPKLLWQMYNAIAIPKMTYAVWESIWTIGSPQQRSSRCEGWSEEETIFLDVLHKKV